MLMPESKKAWFEVRRFMDEITGQGGQEEQTEGLTDEEGVSGSQQGFDR